MDDAPNPSLTRAPRPQSPQRRPVAIPNPKHSPKEPARFSHPAEEAFAKVLDFYHARWQYEPMTFPLEWDEDGRVITAFSPDFYLVDEDLYVELTTLRQRLVTKKNRKLRLLHKLYPDVKCKLIYRRDVAHLAIKYGLFEQASDSPAYAPRGPIDIEQWEDEPEEDVEMEQEA